MKARITFRSEIFIEGKNLNEIMEKFSNIRFFSDEAIANGAEFIETISAENEETHKDLFDGDDEEDDDDEETPKCIYCGGDLVITEDEARGKNDYTLYKCLECGNEFAL